MDTGIAEHPDLAGSVIARVDFVNDRATLLDPSGHGTFVAGLIAAHGDTFKGVAPDAKLISLRVLDQNGKGTMRSVLAAFDWLLQNRTTMGIKVLNLSFGAPQRSSYHRELLAGVVVRRHHGRRRRRQRRPRGRHRFDARRGSIRHHGRLVR